MDLSVIIVNYNTKKLLRNLLISLKESSLGKHQVEVIVVDNASTDGSVEQIKNLKLKIKNCGSKFKIKLIENKENLGYAKANNQGIRIAKGRYILLLNSDTLLNRTCLQEMIKFMDKNQQYAASTCLVELRDGKIDPACHRGFPQPWAAFTYFFGLENFFPQSRLFGQYHQTWKDLNVIHRVDVISGAFFLVRKKVLDQIGLLDERFFMYAEDIDLCYRIKELGQEIAFNPNTKIIHYKRSSGRKKIAGKKVTQKERLVRKKATRYFFETMKLFYDKHYRDRYPWIVRKIVLLGIWVVSKIKD